MPAPQTEVLSQRQKHVVGGGLLLALGLALGIAIDEDDPARNDKLEAIAARASADVRGGKPVDVAAYHRVVTAARAGRSDITDLLTAEVEPGAVVTASVNVELGARPSSVEYTGAAVGRFDTVSLTFADRDGATEIVLVARNTSTETLRLTAFVQFTKGR